MIQETLEELVENFTLFDDWEERYAYLIDMGRVLPVFDEAMKCEKYLVRGCISRVWMVPDVSDDGAFTFEADSDSHIVRGLIAVLMRAYSGRSVEDLASVDIEGAFKRMGLDQHLSINRRNGFFSMVERIKAYRVT